MTMCMLKFLRYLTHSISVSVNPNIHDSGKISTDKKTFLKNCRLVSHMSLVLKVFLRVILASVQSGCKEKSREIQFEFKGELHAREAVFSIKLLI